MLYETPLIKRIKLKLGSQKRIRVFRNNIGLAYVGKVIKKNSIQILINNFRVIKFGLFKGSGDLIGWKEITITEDMIGKKIAQFISIEVKRPKGIRSNEQINWCNQVKNAGGKGVFVENPEEIDI